MADTKKNTPPEGETPVTGNTAAPGTPSAAPPPVQAPATVAEQPPKTFKEKLAAVVPDEGNINVFAPDSKYVARNNFVHGYEGSRYINLRNIDPELAEMLASDPKCAFLEKKKESAQ